LLFASRNVNTYTFYVSKFAVGSPALFAMQTMTITREDDMTIHLDSDLLPLVARIVSAYVSNNEIEAADLPEMIRSTYTALVRVDVAPETKPLIKLRPAVPIDKSVFPDCIICLEDGKRLKMLKRHLITAYGLTPELYRKRWGLPPDYPMVAADYAKRRSNLAKTIGLGLKAAMHSAPEKPDIQIIAEGVSGLKRTPKKDV
jgi:predicted transcriptional regulator